MRPLTTIDPTYVGLRDECVVLLNQKSGPEAEVKCRKLLSKYPERAEAHYLLGSCLSQSQKPELAFPFFEGALRLEPNNPFYKYALGRLYTNYELFEYALPLLKQAIASQPMVSEFQSTIAEIYLEVDQPETAMHHFEIALQQAKTQVAKHNITIALLSCLVTIGEVERAKLISDKLLHSTNPSHRIKVLREALMLRDGQQKSDIVSEIKSRIEDSATSPSEQIELCLLLGGSYDNDGNHDLAFETWTSARRISKSQPWLVQPREQHLKTFRSFYTNDLFEAVAEFGHKSDVPVFVVGMPRSGTTLTEQILAAHPDCAGVGELKRWVKLETAFQKDYPPENQLERMTSNAVAGELKARADEALRYFELIADGKFKRIVEKTPHNFQALGYHRLCFPKSRFVHCRRNPLDTFVSTYRENMHPSHGYAYDQVEYFKEWIFHDKLMSYWKSLFPDQILTLHYEDLVTAPDLWARKLIDFVGLPWDDKCLKYFESDRTVRTYSMMQVRKPIYISSVERWQRYEKHLGPILGAMAEADFEYSTTTQIN